MAKARGLAMSAVINVILYAGKKRIISQQQYTQPNYTRTDLNISNRSSA